MTIAQFIVVMLAVIGGFLSPVFSVSMFFFGIAVGGVLVLSPLFR